LPLHLSQFAALANEHITMVTIEWNAHLFHSDISRFPMYTRFADGGTSPGRCTVKFYTESLTVIGCPSCSLGIYIFSFTH
jgi:hypothetical protein